MSVAASGVAPSSPLPVKRNKPESVPNADADAATVEQAHVHSVYSAIAEHFSGTRYKAWPLVAAFLESLPSFSFVADVGCGNGKYFAAAQQRATALNATTAAAFAAVDGAVAVDKAALDSPAAVSWCPPLSSSAAPADLSCPAAPAHRYVVGLDYSMELLRCTQRSLVDPNMHREQPRRRLRGKHARDEAEAVAASPVSCAVLPRTDVVRSDAMRCPFRGGVFDAAISIAVIHHYASSERRRLAVRELLRLVRPRGGRVLIYVWAREQAGRAKRVVDPDTGDSLVRWERQSKFDAEQQVFHRYYHFFTQGELEQLCAEAAAGRDGEEALPYVLRDSYFDKENWCVMVERCSEKAPFV